MKIIQSIYSPKGFNTPSASRAGKTRALWHTYIWSPSLPKGGWTARSPNPKTHKTWSPEAKHAYTILTAPGRRLDSTTEKALFASIESKTVKPLHALYERGDLSFEEATASLRSGLPAIIESLRTDLPEGQEAIIPIPITTPKATIDALSKPWQAALWSWRILSIALVLPWLIYAIKQCIPKYRNRKNDANRLWSPGAGHISLILVPIKKQNGQLGVGEYEYFDSKGLAANHRENRLEGGDHYVKDLIPEINTILAASDVQTPEVPVTSHSSYQFQTDTHNCGYFVYRYALLRSLKLSPIVTLNHLQETAKTIDLQRKHFHFSLLNDFLPIYNPSPLTEEHRLAAEAADIDLPDETETF